MEFHAAEQEGRTTGWFSELSFSPRCDPSLVAALLEGREIPIEDLSTVYDEFLLYLSWVNSMHFNNSVQYLAQTGYVAYMIETLPDRSFASCVSEYIIRRIRCRAGKGTGDSLSYNQKEE